MSKHQAELTDTPREKLRGISVFKPDDYRYMPLDYDKLRRMRGMRPTNKLQTGETVQ